MEKEQELQKALNELHRITGLTFRVDTGTGEQDQALALTQIRCLCTAYKEKYNKTAFLYGLMTGGIPSFDIQDRAAKLHIDPDASRILFLLESESLDETATEILKNMFPSRTETYLVPVSNNVLAILKSLHSGETAGDTVHTAQTIVDTLNTEALIRVHLSYSFEISTLSDLREAFQETGLALQVGKLFYSDRTVFPYNELGIGRLIYQLPASLCEKFLKEIFGPEIPESLDEELLGTINRFFHNNLNIAETSRQLHMHRNTLIYRIEQIQKITGLDLRRFEDAMTFKIAVMVLNYLRSERKI